MKEAIKEMLAFEKDLSAEQLNAIRELEQVLNSEASLGEIALKFMDLWNHFHEGFPFDD